MTGIAGHPSRQRVGLEEAQLEAQPRLRHRHRQMRAVHAQAVVSIPGILLITAIAYTLGRGTESLCVALAATLWVGVMRLVRGEVLKHKGREYVLVARALGAGPGRLMFGEILPNVMHVGIVTASLILLEAVKAEVILTYLGIPSRTAQAGAF